MIGSTHSSLELAFTLEGVQQGWWVRKCPDTASLETPLTQPAEWKVQVCTFDSYTQLFLDYSLIPVSYLGMPKLFPEFESIIQ